MVNEGGLDLNAIRAQIQGSPAIPTDLTAEQQRRVHNVMRDVTQLSGAVALSVLEAPVSSIRAALSMLAEMIDTLNGELGEE
jgi:hypothetical protein